MMAHLLGEELPSAYEEKLAMLLRHHIALWDSIGSCEREGSLDSAIRNEQGNDFAALLQAYPGIRAIYFNGGKSAQAFKRYNKALLARPDIAFHAMPSTSPANARWRLPMLEETWRKALTEWESSAILKTRTSGLKARPLPNHPRAIIDRRSICHLPSG